MVVAGEELMAVAMTVFHERELDAAVTPMQSSSIASLRGAML